MRDATVHYLQKSFEVVKSLSSEGRKSSIFGYGTEDITFNKSGSFIDLVSSARNKGVLEYHNVTIPAGISIVGNTYMAGEYSGIAYPFYLKVNGTLTVNGVLNMNGLGQPGYGDASFHDSHDARYGIEYTQLGYTLPALGDGQPTFSESVRNGLYHIGEKETFFNGKTYLIGAGNSRTYKWKKATKNRYRHSKRSTPLNSGGNPPDGRHHSGGGGGFLALYYTDLEYNGPRIKVAGIEYPAHINANGGNVSGISWDGAPVRRGGGMMVIAARKIVVGPNGYICCNPCTSANMSTSSNPVLGDSSFNKGGMALMNLPWEGHNWDYVGGDRYNPGHNYSEAGGPGVVFGYKINPEFREQNR